MFTGTGALDIGIMSVLEVEPAWFVEHDPSANKVLGCHWPRVPNHRDATTTDWSTVEPVDVLCGGFPCQDVSLNGRRGGLLKADDGTALFTTRSPWEGMREAITTLKPRLVIIENVRGLLSAPVSAVGPDSEAVGGAFGRVLSDLAVLGFDAEWMCVPASRVGAAHRRTRVFLVAVTPDDRSEERARWPGFRAGQPAPFGWGRLDDCVVAPVVGWGRFRPAIERWGRVVGRSAPPGLVVGPDGGLVTNPIFMEWFMGLPEGHVTGVPGISPEQQRRLLGNGVVPHQTALALSILLGRADQRMVLNR